MGQETLDKIVETMKKLEKNQKNLESRITKLTEICRDRFKRVEKEFNAKYQAHDEEVMNRKKEEIKVSDTIAILEAEHDVIADRITVIDEALEAINTNIDELKSKPDNVIEDKQVERKQCKYD